MREFYVVFVKTKRARLWHPLAIYTRKSHAATKVKELRAKWPKMDCQVSIVEDR